MWYDMLLLYTHRSWDDFKDGQNGGYHPIGLHSIAAYLKQHYYVAKVECASSKNLIQYLDSELDDIPVVGFSCLQDNLQIAINAIKHIKKKYSNKIVMVGGPQAIHLGPDFCKETGCDIIMRGEGEIITKELLDYFLKGVGDLRNIKGIVHIEHDEIIDTGVADVICDLDSLPMIEIEYGPNERIGSVITGRGCPNHCAFCFDGNDTRKVRYRSIEKVIMEIEHMLEKNPQLDIIQILDDTFLMNVDRAYKLCDFFKKYQRKKTIKWICDANVINIVKHPEMVKRMIDSGLVSMQIGIESGCDDVLKAYHKPSNNEMIKKTFRICKEAGLKSLEGQIIVGGAFENDKTIQDDCDLVRDIIKIGPGMTDVSTVFLWPFPCTELTDHPERFDVSISEERVDHSIGSLMNPVTSTKSYSTLQIIYAKKKIDQIIGQTYSKVCLDMKRDEIFQLWDPINMSFKGKWSFYLRSYQHILVSMNNGEYDLFHYVKNYQLSEVFLVRTFSVLEYSGDNLKLFSLEFTGMEKLILEKSNGKNSIKDIMIITGLNEDNVIGYCNKLYQQCLLTFSLC